MTLTEAIRKRICILCAERGLSINKLASLCGITQSTLSNIFQREFAKPTVSTIKNVFLKECYAENPACSCVMDYAKIFAYSFIGYYNIVR